MTQLVTLRQRIKVVEMVKKTTNAMRLISMSASSRLKQASDHLLLYQRTLKSIMSSSGIAITNPDMTREEDLVIVVGSQKGLCGTFNSSLHSFFQLNKPQPAYQLIVIGKQMHDLLKSNQITVDSYYDTFNLTNYSAIAHELTHLITHTEFRNVFVYVHEPKTFFIQKPRLITAWPLPATNHNHESSSEWEFEEDPQEFVRAARIKYLATELSSLLIHSLLAEQASRFLAMDMATRNAENLLNTMKLDYNKLRQALITRELTDLSGSF